MIMAGIDEAGYGPLLGPLAVSCAALQLPDRQGELPTTPETLPCCWSLLKAGVVKKSGPAAKGRLLVADSKIVHNLTNGNKLLERGVLAFLHASSLMPPSATPLTLLRLLDTFGCAHHGLTTHPWYADPETPLPHWTDPGDLAIAANLLRAALNRAQLSVAALRTTLVPEQAFNRLVTGTNNKASALVSITLQHLDFLHKQFSDKGLVVGIDKQGGRDHYTQLLLQSFPEATLRVLLESEAGSSYMLVEGSRRTMVHFREKGETHFLPTALASMICKYLRELCMESFNGWWCRQIAGLKPTAGYYQDGMRWLGDVEAHLPRLGIRREQLVRIR